MRRLRYTLKTHNPHVVFLIETKIDVYRMKRVRMKCGFVNGIEVGADGSRDGLCSAWKEDMVVDLQTFSKNHIDVLMYEMNGDKKCRFTGFYGAPFVSE